MDKEKIDELEFAKKEEEEKKEEEKKNSEENKDEKEKEESKKTEEKVEEEDKEEDKKKKTQFAKEEEEEKEEVCPECGKPLSECTCEEEEKKTNYNLEEIPEYTSLQEQYEQLQTEFSALNEVKENLETELLNLREFKAITERKEKEEMINSFYMLSEEDKQDVVNNIDEYSLEDIEGKLSIICVRNKVNFNLEEEKKEEKPVSYGLNSGDLEDNVPAWVRAARKNQNSN